jgi:hypothetical protein
MRRHLHSTLPILAVAGLLSSCSKVKEATEDLLSFNIDRNIPEQSIEPIVAPCQVVETLDLPLVKLDNIEFSKEEDFPEQNTEVRLIRSARLNSLVLNLTAESTQENWDWLESIDISIASDGRETQRLAYYHEIPDGLSTLNLTTEAIDIAAYIKSDAGFSLSTEAEGCPPAKQTVFAGSYQVAVSASPL